MSSIPAGTSSIQVECVSQKKFKYLNIEYDLKEFYCRDWNFPSTKQRSGSCFNSAGVLFDIGFPVANRFIQSLSVCHNTGKSTTYYSEYNLNKYVDVGQKGVDRPKDPNNPTGNYDYFNDAVLKDAIKNKGGANALYSEYVQKQTIMREAKIQENQYTFTSARNFLNRGHLAAKADFFGADEQRSTFFLVNAAPQFKMFNEYNWNEIEICSRKLAARKNIELKVYTGTYGIMKLNNVELYLGRSRISVPKLYYKILIDMTNKGGRSGVVFLGVNNPHLQEADFNNMLRSPSKDSYVICKDVSGRLDAQTKSNWKTKSFNDKFGKLVTYPEAGFVYACEVSEFLKVVTEFRNEIGKIGNVNKLLV